MNILHINQSDIAGGAAIAGYRLHQGLLTQGIRSKLMVGDIKTQSELVSPVPRRPNLDGFIFRLSRKIGLNYVHVAGSFDIPKQPIYQAADILNFHNLHNGYFNYLAISHLAKHKPAIYTLHDMWSFTGHCSYSYDCERWKTGCGQCPYPNIYPEIPRDSTALEWKLKNWIYSQAKLTIVAPSRWLVEQAKSSILSRFPIYHIPYGIDTSIFKPLDAAQCRDKLGIPIGKKVLMFGAETITDRRKGGDLLLQALIGLPDSLKAEIILLTIGTGGEAIKNAIGINTLDIGYIKDDRLKAIAYSAADLFVFPTRADNLPLVLQESMACGTPMVSFDVGGVPDLVRPKVTGYLAAPEDANDLCNRIVQLLANNDLRQKMRLNCREIALKEYPLELQAQRYIQLYQQALVM